MEKFCIKDLVAGEISEESCLEFQVYSSHHVSRRHLVGVASVRLLDVDHLPGGQTELIVMPQTVYRVSNLVYEASIISDSHGEFYNMYAWHS